MSVAQAPHDVDTRSAGELSRNGSTSFSWGPTARVQSLERLGDTTRVVLSDSMGRIRDVELNIVPDSGGVDVALGERRPLAVLVVVREHRLDCAVIATTRSRSGRVDITPAQALGLAERGVRCIFRR